ncbi:MAG TPA: hypothetical protein VK947_08490 [Planococcus sp. (in: firmicutes)]|nr:hypothetical protein [Planococcus sp. (in: firmicutes)]
MRYLQYKGVVEREYKKSLKKIMHHLCIEKGLNAAEGARELGVAKQIFVYWRNHYRFERRQLLFDETVNELDQMESLYAEEAQKIDLKKPLKYENEKSVDGMEELIERMVDYYKLVHYKSKGLSTETAQLPLYQFTLELIGDYKEGELLEEAKIRCEG